MYWSALIHYDGFSWRRVVTQAGGASPQLLLSKDSRNPTFPSTYGYEKTRLIIALSSIGATVSTVLGFLILGLAWGYIRLLAVLSTGIIGLAVFSIYRPSEKLNFGLFKYASLYMLGAMLMVFFGSMS